MSRITKQIAESTAKALVKTKKNQIAELDNAFKKRLQNEVSKEIPKEILVFYKKHKSYVKSTCCIQISGYGWDFNTVYLDNEIPSRGGNKIQYIPDEKTAIELLELYNDLENKKDLVSKLEKDLEVTIFNLRTYKSVQENFPEAFELLPKIVNNSVQLNLSDVRNRIKE